MLGILIISAIVAAGAAAFALAMGAAWWVALLIYAFGGAALTVSMAILVSLRKEVINPAGLKPSTVGQQDPLVEAKVNLKPHAETV